MELVWILAIVFVFVTLLFIVLAVFLPEWVGIQGKKAQSVQALHQEDSAPPSSDQTASDLPATEDLNKK